MAKYGEGHVTAMGRKGFKEVGQALQAFPGQGVQSPEEPGVFGNATQAQVTEQMGGIDNYNLTLDAKGSVHGSKAQEYEAKMAEAAQRGQTQQKEDEKGRGMER